TKIAKRVTRPSSRFRHHTQPPSRPQPLPSFFRPESTVLGLWLASAAHSSSVVPVAGDATASPGALASLRRPRSARSETDGGKNARADNQRTASDDTKGTLRSRGAYRRPAADLSRWLDRPHRSAHQPAQHPLGAGAARFLAVNAGPQKRPGRALRLATY